MRRVRPRYRSVAIRVSVTGSVVTAMMIVVALSATFSPAAVRATPPIKQCTNEAFDRWVTYPKVPQRIVTTDAYAAEMLITLGLGSKIVGTGVPYPKGHVPLAIQPAYNKIPVLAQGFPTNEQLVNARADIVVTSFRTDRNGNLSRDTLRKRFGIALYGSVTVCQSGKMRSFDDIFADIRNIGQIFQVQQRAETVIAQMKKTLAKAAAIARGKPRVKIWTYSGEDVPYPATGGGVANAVIWLAGGQNIFEDVPKPYAAASWEQVVARNPDKIWLMTDAGDTFLQAQGALAKALQSNPALAGVTAVKNHDWFALSYEIAGTENVPRSATAVLALAKALHGGG